METIFAYSCLGQEYLSIYIYIYININKYIHKYKNKYKNIYIYRERERMLRFLSSAFTWFSEHWKSGLYPGAGFLVIGSTDILNWITVCCGWLPCASQDFQQHLHHLPTCFQQEPILDNQMCLLGIAKCPLGRSYCHN